MWSKLPVWEGVQIMATFSTKIHTPAASAPATSGKVAKCGLCGVQWQVRDLGPDEIDAQRCDFCGASDEAISIINEDNNYPQPIIIGL